MANRLQLLVLGVLALVATPRDLLKLTVVVIAVIFFLAPALRAYMSSQSCWL